MTPQPRICRGCGASFEGEPWQKKCWSCWRREKDRQADRDAYDRGFVEGMVAGLKRAGLDRELLTAAISLTHPDRHPAERHELATSTTAALLELRAEIAA